MTALRKTASLALGALLVALTPALAFACPVCFSANEANRLAYTTTFVFLTVLPLISVGAIVWWIRKRIRETAGVG